MRLEIIEFLPGEVAHHYESADGDFIFSASNRFWGRAQGRPFGFAVPFSGWKRAASGLRLLRRLLRTDKSNAVFNPERDGIVVLFAGGVFFYDLGTERLTRVSELRQCRNALHQGVAVSTNGIFFGEYGPNESRAPVPVWASYDGGRAWGIVYEFPAGSIKHVHGVYHDPFTDDLWLASGDFEGECCVARADPSFHNVERFGDGSQSWRPVSMLFEKDVILFPMDSPLERSRIQVFDRHAKTLTAQRPMDGPMWYTKRLEDGITLLQTTVEIGPGVVSDHSQVHASRDLRNWQEVARYRKDRWPMPWFKFGVIGFADGAQDSGDFVMFGEGVHVLDGCIARARLVSD